MKGELKKMLDRELGWWRKADTRERLYMVYFAVSLILLIGLAGDNNPLWVPVAALLNLSNAVRLVRSFKNDIENEERDENR